MGKWGAKTKWAKNHFAPADSFRFEKKRRPRIEDVAQVDAPVVPNAVNVPYGGVSYRCKRCDGLVMLPLITATGRPDAALLVLHLESGACRAGAISFEEHVSDAQALKMKQRLEDEATIKQFVDGLVARGDTHVSCVWLVNPKTPQNMGSALRAMSVFQDGDALFYTGNRFEIAAQFATDPHDGGASVPKIHVHAFRNVIQWVHAHWKHSYQIVAVDLIARAVPLHLFQHKHLPNGSSGKSSEGMSFTAYVLGPEDGTIPEDVIALCDAAVYVPTKGSMNLAATVNVVLYDRQSKHLLAHPGLLEDAAQVAASCRNVNNNRSVQ